MADETISIEFETNDIDDGGNNGEPENPAPSQLLGEIGNSNASVDDGIGGAAGSGTTGTRSDPEEVQNTIPEGGAGGIVVEPDHPPAASNDEDSGRNERLLVAQQTLPPLDAIAHQQPGHHEEKVEQSGEANDDTTDDEKEHTVTEGDELTIREKLFYLFDGLPYPSQQYRYPILAFWSFTVINIILLLIVVSSVNFCVMTLPEYQENEPLWAVVVEAFCIGVFTFELLVRFFACSDKLAFVKSVLNWVDFISVIPFYINLVVVHALQRGSTGLDNLVILRVLRLARVFRILKLSKHSLGIMSVGSALVQSADALVLLVFMLTILLIMSSAAMYFAEQTDGTVFNEELERWIRRDGTASPFQSIFHSLYWCVTTVSTVGYGDEVPITGLGKTVGSITMICGVFTIAFPTVVIGANFKDSYERELAEAERKRGGAPLKHFSTLVRDAFRAMRGLPVTQWDPVTNTIEIDGVRQVPQNDNGQGAAENDDGHLGDALDSPSFGLSFNGFPLPNDEALAEEVIITALSKLTPLREEHFTYTYHSGSTPRNLIVSYYEKDAVVKYSPALVFGSPDTPMTVVATPPYYRIDLILFDPVTHKRVLEQVSYLNITNPSKNKVSSQPLVAPMFVARIELSVAAPPALTRRLGLQLLTTEIDEPPAVVPIYFECDSIEEFLANTENISFGVDVFFEQPGVHTTGLDDYIACSVKQ